MEQLLYLLPALIIALGIQFAYRSYKQQVQKPMVSPIFINWITFLIVATGITLGTAQAPEGKLGFILFTAIVTGLYFFYVRPRIYGK